MITFEAADFEKALPEIRDEVRATAARADDRHTRFVLLSAEEYERLRGGTAFNLTDAPPELLEEMARQLDAACDELEAAEREA